MCPGLAPVVSDTDSHARVTESGLQQAGTPHQERSLKIRPMDETAKQPAHTNDGGSSVANGGQMRDKVSSTSTMHNKHDYSGKVDQVFQHRMSVSHTVREKKPRVDFAAGSR